MAGVNNPPNLKPIIDAQSTAQSSELTAAAQAINTSVDSAKAELSAKSDSVKAAIDAAQALITNDAQLKADALAVIVEAAKDAVLADVGEKINALQLAVDAPKSVIKSVQRGSTTTKNEIVNIASINPAKSILTVNGSGMGGDVYIESESELRLMSGTSYASSFYWQVIEYV